MDPLSRRHVWELVTELKRESAVILTTHSMEEADILGDRVAIMARGRLHAIGSPIHLKQQYGAGYSISIAVQVQSDLNMRTVAISFLNQPVWSCLAKSLAQVKMMRMNLA